MRVAYGSLRFEPRESDVAIRALFCTRIPLETPVVSDTTRQARASALRDTIPCYTRLLNFAQNTDPIAHALQGY